MTTLLMARNVGWHLYTRVAPVSYSRQVYKKWIIYSAQGNGISASFLMITLNFLKLVCPLFELKPKY